MKKLDKFILKSFFAPFILTLVVVIFILLIINMLKYFDDLVGKDIGIGVFVELLTYFSVNTTPQALPLAILLSSLMTFGNLGEHFELTAIKSSGISLVRIMLPIFLFSSLMTVLAFFNNNHLVPYATLKALNLLYDIKKAKPSLDVQEGVFYDGIPGYTIKVNDKHPDGITLEDIIIYKHKENGGNKHVILADSGRMYTIMGERYLVLELFRGNRYAESIPKKKNPHNTIANFTRTEFYKNKMVFSLSSFGLDRGDPRFDDYRMKSSRELHHDIDSINHELIKYKRSIYQTFNISHSHGQAKSIKLPKKVIQLDSMFLDTLRAKNISSIEVDQASANLSLDTSMLWGRKDYRSCIEDSALAIMDTIFDTQNNSILNSALSKARNTRSFYQSLDRNVSSRQYKRRRTELELYKKWGLAVSCLIFFLIGAPLGAIIKKGGLGVPVIVSIFFFITFYVITMTGEKWVKQELAYPFVAAWAANVILLPFGFYFLNQARKDSRLFDVDYYVIMFENLRDWVWKSH